MSETSDGFRDTFFTMFPCQATSPKALNWLSAADKKKHALEIPPIGVFGNLKITLQSQKPFRPFEGYAMAHCFTIFHVKGPVCKALAKAFD